MLWLYSGRRLMRYWLWSHLLVVKPRQTFHMNQPELLANYIK